MQKTNTTEALKVAILGLEHRQGVEAILLKELLSETYENLKPLNVLRNVINEFTRPTRLKDNLIQVAFSLISGYLTRKMFARSSNPLIRLIGVFVQQGVTRFVANNSVTIKTVALHFIFKIIGGLKGSKK